VIKTIVNSVVVLGAAVLLLSGCSVRRQGDMSMLSTRNVNLDQLDLDELPQTKRVIGKDSRWILLFFPIGFPRLEGAVDDALDKGDGDVMVDAVMYSKRWWFLIGQNTMKVKGTVVKTRAN
jgi:hypothetical protein